MKLKISIILLCAIGLFAACEKDDIVDPQPTLPREKVSRTVLVYLVGDNTSNDLSSLLMGNFRDMKVGMESVDDADCNLLVYSEMKNDTPHYIRLRKQSGRVIADTLFSYSEQNPLDKDVMSKILTQTIHLFPADSYGFVILSHGDGWIPGVSPNSRSVGDYKGTQMNIADFHQVLKSTQCHFDFILFDDCFMQSVEVAYELRDCVDYFIGSPTEIPGPGAPYKSLTPYLFAKENVAQGIANSYFSFYDERYTGVAPSSSDNWTGGVSVSVIKSAALETLAVETQKVLAKYVTNQQSIDVSSVMCYDKRSSNYKYYKCYYDFDGLMISLTHQNADYKKWRQAFDSAVIQWNTTPRNYSGYVGMFSMEGAEGLSTYIPRSFSPELNSFYRTYEWYTDAGWALTGW